jgi:hypothetical protein
MKIYNRFLAATKGNLQEVKFSIRNGADVNVKDPSNNHSTPLMNGIIKLINYEINIFIFLF